MSERYNRLYRHSMDDPETFWGDAAEAIDWDRRWDRVIDDGATPAARWFAGGMLNTCHNALDRHVAAGIGDRMALIHDSPVTGTQQRFTYVELRDRVAKFAGALAARGVGHGDRVVIYMPMVPEAAIAMLACARIGAIHSVVFGGFAANELAVRIDDSTPKAIVAGSCGIEPGRVVRYKPLLDRAIEIARHKPDFCVVFQREAGPGELVPGRDVDWNDAVAAASPVDCVPVAATDPLYILYTSGTTGQPKGIVRDNGGHAVALNWSMPNIYDTAPGEVFWAASDVGWVVGHSYIVYAPLFNGSTSILFEGKPIGTPDAGVYWRVIAEHGIKTLFTAPHRLPRDQEGRSGMRAPCRARPVPLRDPVPCRRAGRPRHRQMGRGPSRRAGDRPLVGRPRRGGRSPPTASASGGCRSSTDRPPARCPAGTCGCWTRRATSARRARSALWSRVFPCRPAARRRCGTPTTGSARPI